MNKKCSLNTESQNRKHKRDENKKRCKCDNLEENPLNPKSMRCLDCLNVVMS